MDSNVPFPVDALTAIKGKIFRDGFIETCFIMGAEDMAMITIGICHLIPDGHKNGASFHDTASFALGMGSPLKLL